MKTLEKCRISQSANLIQVLSLGDQELTGVFPKSRQQTITRGPLRLVWSPESQLLQLGDTFEAAEMYGDNYGYRSGLNQSMVAHLTSKIQILERKAQLQAGDYVLDIGSNDATSLKAYRTGNIRRLGIDPTGRKFAHYYTDGIRLFPEFFPSDALRSELGGNKAKIVTSIAMFYDLDDPVGFAQSVSDILAPDGIWHLEQSYMPSMIRLNSYDTICHEHLEYYSLHSLKYVLDRAGLRIVDVQMNAVNGGSFAITACHRDSPIRGKERVIGWLLEQEIRMGFDTPAPFRSFEARVYEHRKALRSLIDMLIADGNCICGYGASTKGNVMLQFCGLEEKQIRCIAEINPDKYGAFTPGTGIPIVSGEEAAAMKPDYYLVLPWHFRDGIIRREQEFIARGGKLIFPFPEIEIVGG